ncbi:MAG: DUF2127 domain-containing protein [Patescibacteria group bacterium]
MVRLNFHNLFRLGLLIKWIDGFVGMIGGFVVLFINTDTIIKVFNFVTRYELIEDPKDIAANIILKFAENLSIDTKIFIALYLIGYSLVKVFLVTGLWRNKKWSYSTAIVVMTVFIVYQIVREFYTYSLTLALFTVIDMIIVYLIYLEFRRQHQGRFNY